MEWFHIVEYGKKMREILQERWTTFLEFQLNKILRDLGEIHKDII